MFFVIQRLVQYVNQLHIGDALFSKLLLSVGVLRVDDFLRRDWSCVWNSLQKVSITSNHTGVLRSIFTWRHRIWLAVGFENRAGMRWNELWINNPAWVIKTHQSQQPEHQTRKFNQSVTTTADTNTKQCYSSKQWTKKPSTRRFKTWPSDKKKTQAHTTHKKTWAE